MSRNETKQHTLDRVLNVDGLRTMERHAAIDLDWFLNLSSERRQAVWRAWPDVAKRQAIIQQLERKQGEWSEAQVEICLNHWNNRWGAELMTTEAAILAALDDGVDRAAVAETHATARNDSDEAAYFAAERAAYQRARTMYRDGFRPTQQADGSWIVPSASADAAYLVTRAGVCNCIAGQHERHCKHVALIAATESGLDNLNVFDDYDIEAEYADAAASIARRLCAARMQYQAA